VCHDGPAERDAGEVLVREVRESLETMDKTPRNEPAAGHTSCEAQRIGEKGCSPFAQPDLNLGTPECWMLHRDSRGPATVQCRSIDLEDMVRNIPILEPG
jgi:hypothetical protein